MRNLLLITSLLLLVSCGVSKRQTEAKSTESLTTANIIQSVSAVENKKVTINRSEYGDTLQFTSNFDRPQVVNSRGILLELEPVLTSSGTQQVKITAIAKPVAVQNTSYSSEIADSVTTIKQLAQNEKSAESITKETERKPPNWLFIGLIAALIVAVVLYRKQLWQLILNLVKTLFKI